jgi:hypothetical protein
MKIKKYNDFNEAKYFGDLSPMDQKKFDVIDRKIWKKIYNFKERIESEIKIYKEYINDYKLSKDLKDFIKEEIKYLERSLKRYEEFEKEKKKK